MRDFSGTGVQPYLPKEGHVIPKKISPFFEIATREIFLAQPLESMGAGEGGLWIPALMSMVVPKYGRIGLT